MKKSLLALTLMAVVAFACAPANADFNGYRYKLNQSYMRLETDNSK